MCYVDGVQGSNVTNARNQILTLTTYISSLLPNCLHPRVLQDVGEGTRRYPTIFQSFLDLGTVHFKSKIAHAKMIFEKGERGEQGNCRPDGLTSVVDK